MDLRRTDERTGGRAVHRSGARRRRHPAAARSLGGAGGGRGRRGVGLERWRRVAADRRRGGRHSGARARRSALDLVVGPGDRGAVDRGRCRAPNVLGSRCGRAAARRAPTGRPRSGVGRCPRTTRAGAGPTVGGPVRPRRRLGRRRSPACGRSARPALAHRWVGGHRRERPGLGTPDRRRPGPAGGTAEGDPGPEAAAWPDTTRGADGPVGVCRGTPRGRTRAPRPAHRHRRRRRPARGDDRAPTEHRSRGDGDPGRTRPGGAQEIPGPGGRPAEPGAGERACWRGWGSTCPTRDRGDSNRTSRHSTR